MFSSGRGLDVVIAVELEENRKSVTFPNQQVGVVG